MITAGGFYSSFMFPCLMLEPKSVNLDKIDTMAASTELLQSGEGHNTYWTGRLGDQSLFFGPQVYGYVLSGGFIRYTGESAMCDPERIKVIQESIKDADEDEQKWMKGVQHFCSKPEPSMAFIVIGAILLLLSNILACAHCCCCSHGYAATVATVAVGAATLFLIIAASILSSMKGDFTVGWTMDTGKMKMVDGSGMYILIELILVGLLMTLLWLVAALKMPCARNVPRLARLVKAVGNVDASATGPVGELVVVASKFGASQPTE